MASNPKTATSPVAKIVNTVDDIPTVYVDELAKMQINSGICRLVFSRIQKDKDDVEVRHLQQQIVMPTKEFLEMVANLYVGLNKNKGVIIEQFNTHVQDLSQALEALGSEAEFEIKTDVPVEKSKRRKKVAEE